MSDEHELLSHSAGDVQPLKWEMGDLIARIEALEAQVRELRDDARMRRLTQEAGAQLEAMDNDGNAAYTAEGVGDMMADAKKHWRD